MFNPADYGYPLRADFEKRTLERLLDRFETEVKREIDKKLAKELRAQLLNSSSQELTKSTFERLARWCKTDGIYGDGMDIAQRISELLFGRIVDRSRIGT